MAGSCECGNEPSGSIKCEKVRVAEDLLAPQEGLCSMELVISFTTHIGMHNKINTENVP
jgi:hypothetical protein